jgi:hypothetical protein
MPRHAQKRDSCGLRNRFTGAKQNREIPPKGCLRVCFPFQNRRWEIYFWIMVWELF